MTHSEKRLWLIDRLLKERGEYAEIPDDKEAQQRLLRALINVRAPKPADEEFLKVEGEYLKEAIAEKGITDVDSLVFQDGLSLWKGDITTLAADGIVNAANSEMLGCFYPCHGCIDNAIHTYAGTQLRLKCFEIMRLQGHEEPTGNAKITPAFNLPSKYILHTVGPIVSGELTEFHRGALASCYRSCLELADQNRLSTLAFCCISTGEFCFPNDEAAQIAIATVKKYRETTNSSIKIIFNVFKEHDYAIYSRLLGKN